MKVCSVCGKRYEYGEYCPMCGGKLVEEQNRSGTGGQGAGYQQNKKTPVLPFVLLGAGILAVFAVCVIVGGILFFHSRKEASEVLKNVSEEPAKVPDDNISVIDQSPSDNLPFDNLPDNEADEAEESGETEFYVTPGIEENYMNALQPELYRYYDSGIEDFSFSYPDNLYSDVTVEENQSSEYGHLVKRITFTGSSGSELIYQIIRRTDSMSIGSETDFVYNTESAGIYAKEDIIYSSQEDYGRVIVTGWDSSAKNYVIYDLCKIEADYILQMKIVFPDYTSESDKVRKGYVTECYYRLCGFSGADDPVRSYEDFVKNN